MSSRARWRALAVRTTAVSWSALGAMDGRRRQPQSDRSEPLHVEEVAEFGALPPARLRR